MELTCPNCRHANDPSASFCSRCGTALGSTAGGTPSAPTGWDLATAGMAQPALAVDPRTGPLRKEELAGWWQRLGAAILDGIILGLLVMLVGGLVAAAAYLADPTIFDDVIDAFAEEATSSSDPFDPSGTTTYDGDAFEELGLVVMLAFMVVGVALSLAWETLWLRSRFMAKPGQAVAGFRVVTASEPARLTTGRALGRGAAKLIYNIPNLGGLIYIVSAFTIGLSERKQALHDMIASTACVRTSALEHRGVRDATGAVLPAASGPPFAPSSMQDHVAGAPNHATTEVTPGGAWGSQASTPPPPPPASPQSTPPTPPPPPGTGGSGPFV